MKKLLLITCILIAFAAKAQVRLVKDCRAGVGSGSPEQPFIYNNRLFFGAAYGTATVAWVTDGTTVGTQNLRSAANNTILSITPNAPFYHVELNGDLYFNVYEANNTNFIYKLTGTSNAATTPVNLFNLFNATNSVFGYPTLLNNKIIFAPLYDNSAPATIGNEPFFTDGTQVGTGLLYNIANGASNSFPVFHAVLNNNLFFSATQLNTTGRELWKTDGTPGGTALFLDINAGAGNSNPAEFNVLGSQLTFVATHNTLGRELFKTNGNSGSLVLIKDINTNGDSNPTNVTELNGILYFSADNGSQGQELWKSNGNNTGTILLKDINLTGNSSPSNFTQLGSEVFFTADDGMNGFELWKTDGTNVGTIMVKNINPTGDSNPSRLTEYNGKLYFNADDGVHGKELWVSDGTDVGTTIIDINTSGSSNPTSLIVFNNELFFAANQLSNYGRELYAYKDPALNVNEFDFIETSISLFPNPTNNYFEIDSNVTLSKVYIYSLQGQLVKSYVPQNQYDISDLSSGMYFVKVLVNNNMVTKRIVKQ